MLILTDEKKGKMFFSNIKYFLPLQKYFIESV